MRRVDDAHEGLSHPVERGRPILAVGLMSGTSADGIDAALVSISEKDGRIAVELRRFLSHPYREGLRQRLFRCFADTASVSEVCSLNAEVGEAFADAAEALLAEAGVQAAELDFVASHGQTVWHQPRPEGERVRSTLQIGEAARIAARLRVPVVCDFRQQDLALGGEGAPLVPYVDYLLLSHPELNRAVQNLGGIGNVTYLRAGGTADEIVAFDTGPGNALIDAAAELVSGGASRYDRDGALAAQAPVDPALLQELLGEPYLLQPPPKSTGREMFGAGKVRLLWDEGHRGPALVSTLTQLTVESIARAYRAWLGPVDEVILGGGGTRNPELVRRLRAAVAPARLLTSGELGLDPDAKEAIAFAVLGYETLRGRPANVPSATGAARPAVLGKVCLP